MIREFLTNPRAFAAIVLLALFGAALTADTGAEGLPACRVVSYEPGRPSSARLSLELTWPDATATPAQRYDCACREWP